MLLSRREIEGIKDEGELRRRVIKPLLEAMGYEDVIHYHGPNERGKDIVAWTRDHLQRRINLAVVAKAKPISGSVEGASSSAGGVVIQVLQGLNKPYLDTRSKSMRKIHKVWVVTNKTLKPDAQDAILSALTRSQMRRVELFDIERLWEDYDKYMPAAAARRAEEIKRSLADLDSHYAADLLVSERGDMLGLREKFPGAAGERPLTFKTKFAFPSTPEGSVALEGYRRFESTGARTVITRPYLEDFEVPELLLRAAREAFGVTDLEVQSVELSTAADPRRLPLRVDVVAESGETFSIPYVELRRVQVGKDEETWTNEAQEIPFMVEMVVGWREQGGSFNIAAKNPPLDAARLLEGLRMQRCAAGSSSIRLTFLETGHASAEMLKTRGQGPPDPRWVEIVRALAEAQGRIGRPIVVPSRKFTRSEWESMGKLAVIVGGGGRARLDGNVIKARLPRRDVEELLVQMPPGSEVDRYFQLQLEENIELFDAAIPLGMPVFHVPRAQIWNRGEIEERLATDAGEIDMVFACGGEERIVVVYPNWEHQDEQAGSIDGEV